MVARHTGTAVPELPSSWNGVANALPHSSTMSGLSSRSSVVPAQLSFLAIYNPSLGSNDENLHDQVVFYSSKASRARSGRKFSSEAGFQVQHEEENEKLRQIGLAQGMVEFAK